MRVARVAVVSLRDREDRRREMTDRLNALDLDIPWAFWDAIDTRPNGLRGCFESHRLLLSESSGPLLVLEDDAVFAPNFKEVLEDLDPPDDWELLYLGGQHISKVDTVSYHDGYALVRPHAVLRTHAYVVRDPQSVGSRLRKIDHIDYALFQLNLRLYAVMPWIVGQSGSTSNVSETVEGPQFWNVDPPNRATNVDRIFKAHYEPPSALKMMSRSGEWEDVGTSANPLNIKMRDGTWRTYAGGSGKPLYMMGRDGEWKVVAREGTYTPPVSTTYTISGTVTLDGVPISGAIVYFYSATAAHSVTANSSGFYTKSGLSPGIWTVRVSRATYLDLEVGVSLFSNQTVNLPMTRQLQTYSFRGMYHSLGPAELVLGWQAEKGWNRTPQDQPMQLTSSETEVGYYNSGVAAYSFALVARTNEPDLIRYWQQYNEQVSWYVVPIKVVRDRATEWFAANTQYYPPTPILVRSVVSISITGASFEKNATRYWNSWSTMPVVPGGYSSGTGSIRRSSASLSSLTGRAWVAASVGNDPGLFPATSPAVRGPTFVREGGSVIWQGALNSLNAAGFTPLVVEDILDPAATLSTDYLIYQLQVDSVPQPKESCPTCSPQEHQYNNELQAAFTLRLEYRY